MEEEEEIEEEPELQWTPGNGPSRWPTWARVIALTSASDVAETSSDCVGFSSSPTTGLPASDVSPLDGRRFRAGIVRDDADEDAKAQPLEDKLLFENGKFSSVVCRRYNFAEAPYWVRVEGDRIHFMAELTSPTDGTMRWTGTIRGNQLTGTMRWTKRRWYWTIDTSHRIRGDLEAGPSVAAPGARP